MKHFEKLNYYEMLDIDSEATPFEIRHAYNMALQVYQDGSLASYSFFSEEERERILARLESAFSTLINEKTRAEYDKMLIRLGVLEGADKGKETARALINSNKTTRIPQKTVTPPVPIPEKRMEVQEEILAQDSITGTDLKRMRTQAGIELEDIAARTKIWIEFLRYIESDQFDNLPSRFHLKGFLKAYVQYFSNQADTIVERYMKRL